MKSYASRGAAVVLRTVAALIVVILSPLAAAQTAPVVQTTHGAVSGLVDDGTYAYKGIPYGADTGGTNRFLPPMAPAAWTGVRDGSSFGPACPQHSPFIGKRPYSEDCLRLSVWTQSVDGSRPVMVWFHGGAFKLGSDNYDAEGVRADRTLTTSAD